MKTHMVFAVILSAWLLWLEARPREGRRTEQLSDGIKVWDESRRYFTTFRYLCWPSAGGRVPFR
jgi:hypothetical protein